MNYWVFCEGETLEAAIADYADDPRHAETGEAAAAARRALVRDFLYSRAAGRHGLRKHDEAPADDD